MSNSLRDQVLALFDRLEAELTALRGDLGRPRAEMHERIDRLGDVLVVLRDDVADGLTAYERLSAAIDAANDRCAGLEAQVTGMERQVRILSAQVRRMESGGDRAGTA